MEDIIRKHEDGGLEIFQGDKRTGILNFEEVLGLIATLTVDSQESPERTREAKGMRELAEDYIRNRVPGWPDK